MTRVGLCAALRSPLVFAQRLFARWNRQALNAKALACITSCGGRIAVSYPADGRTLPVVLGLNGGQMFDPDARIHIWLPALSDAQWSELKPGLQPLWTLGSLQIAGRHVADSDCLAIGRAQSRQVSVGRFFTRRVPHWIGASLAPCAARKIVLFVIGGYISSETGLSATDPP
jgi:hypothetical protein